MTDKHTKNDHDKPLCLGKRRQGEGLCHRPAGWGTKHVGIGRCKLHGGGTPDHNRAAQKVMAQNTAAIYGIPRQVDPAEGLIEEYWRTAGIVAGLETEVASLPREDLVWSTAETVESESGDDSDDTGSGRMRIVKARSGNSAWVKLFNEERDRFAHLGADIIKLGLEARRDEYVRVQVSTFARILLAPELCLSVEQRETAARLLRSLEGDKIITGEVVRPK